MARDRFDPEDMKEFESEAKVGLLATVNAEGLPHVTLITSMQAKDPGHIIWGQFTEGMSKKHVLENPKTGFLIMSLDRKMWRGKALWLRRETEGEDYEMFNRKPMFRYNAYFGIHTVHTMRLVETGGREALPMARIVLASLVTRSAKGGAARRGGGEPVLGTWAEAFFNRLTNLKFLAVVGEDGFPTLTPLIQCQAADASRLGFSPVAFRRELETIRPGIPVAVFGLSMEREDILVRGRFAGWERARLARVGLIDLGWIYNSMPPVPGQVYPPVELEPVVDFGP